MVRTARRTVRYVPEKMENRRSCISYLSVYLLISTRQPRALYVCALIERREAWSSLSRQEAGMSLLWLY